MSDVGGIAMGVAAGIALGSFLANGVLNCAAEEIKPEAEQALWWRKAKMKALRDRELESLK